MSAGLGPFVTLLLGPPIADKPAEIEVASVRANNRHPGSDVLSAELGF